MDDLLDTKDRWQKPSALRGVQVDLDLLKSNLKLLNDDYGSDFQALPPYEEIMKYGYGVGYTKVDAETSFKMLRHLKPKRYIEVGSGISTYYSSRAKALNEAEGHPMEIICIEPYPKDSLYKIDGIQVIDKLVQDVDLDFFSQLEDGDVLFIDSSHSLKIDSDVAYLMLDVLPSIAVGVHIHIHDIPFPYNHPYPAELYMFNKKWPMVWNEPMVVQTFLAFNDSFRLNFSASMVQHHDEDFFRDHVQSFDPELGYVNTISSIWLDRVK